MKLKISVVLLGILLGLAACKQSGNAFEMAQSAMTSQDSETISTGESAQIDDSWQDITEQEAKEKCPNSLKVPDGAENVQWSVWESAADFSGIPGPLVQLTFDLDGKKFTAREQATGNEEIDTSGLYYDWTVEDAVPLSDGKVTVRCYRYIGENKYVDLCTWVDAEVGVSYSVSVIAKDLDGFDLLAIVESVMP